MTAPAVECRPSVYLAVDSDLWENLWEVCCSCGWISALYPTKVRADAAARFHASRLTAELRLARLEQALAEFGALVDKWRAEPSDYMVRRGPPDWLILKDKVTDQDGQ